MNHELAMQATTLAGKVAVITGGASGIGLALAMRAGEAGMKVAIADIETGTMSRAIDRLETMGVDAIAVRTDVSDLASMRELAARVQSSLGDPWLVALNAGVAKLGLSWQLDASDWRWILDVNLNGVINGVATFLPGLVARDAGYLVTTGSAAGLMGVPGGAPYVASKHAVVGLSESIHRELRAQKSAVGISVLCPAAVDTRIAYAERNRPGQPHFEAPTEGLPPVPLPPGTRVLPPAEIARQVFAAVTARRFWILPHADELGPHVLARARQMVDGVNPDARSLDHGSAFIHGMATGLSFVD